MIETAARGDVCGVGYRFSGKCSNMGMFARVEDEVALATLRYEPRLPELTKVLGNSRRRDADVLGEIVDRVLSMKQSPEDPEPGFDRHSL